MVLFDTQYDKVLNSARGKAPYLNIQFGIQEILIIMLAFKSVERTLVLDHAKNLHSRSELVHQVFFGLFPGAKYSKQLTELKRQGREEGKGCLPMTALTPGYCGNI